MAEGSERVEWLKCSRSVTYFLDQYGVIENATLRAWVPFRLWPAQEGVLQQVIGGDHVIVLKARQLGLTWLLIGYSLWLMVFRPGSMVLLFSLRDEEAIELLRRLKGMYQRLPGWMQSRAVLRDNDHEFRLSNGSGCKAFPTTGGRSYTGTFVLVDEADFIPGLSTFLNAVKPTVDAGGQLALVSTSDKDRPLSTFKRLFRAAWRGVSEYRAVFLPWSARPERDVAWYRRIAADMREQDGSDDNLHQEYPETPEQAMAPRTLAKRIPADWVARVSAEAMALPDRFWPSDVPGVPGLVVYRLPCPGGRYVVGVDPAEGNPTSDESALCVLDETTGEQVAVYGGRVQPSTLASYADKLGVWYGADLMVERNNHGHSVLSWLADHSALSVLPGPDRRPGWLSNRRGKVALYDALADACRDGQLQLHDLVTITQVQTIEGSTLRAPEGQPDDRADALALAWAGCGSSVGEASVPSSPPPDPVAEADRASF